MTHPKKYNNKLYALYEAVFNFINFLLCNIHATTTTLTRGCCLLCPNRTNQSIVSSVLRCLGNVISDRNLFIFEWNNTCLRHCLGKFIELIRFYTSNNEFLLKRVFQKRNETQSIKSKTHRSTSINWIRSISFQLINKKY